MVETDKPSDHDNNCPCHLDGFPCMAPESTRPIPPGGKSDDDDLPIFPTPVCDHVANAPPHRHIPPEPSCSHCPPGCVSCEPVDCECYAHQDDRRFIPPAEQQGTNGSEEDA